MELLGPRNALLISQAVKMMSGIDSDLILSYIIEDLYVDEIDEIRYFLQWLIDMDLRITEDKLEGLFQDFKRSLRTQNLIDSL